MTGFGYCGRKMCRPLLLRLVALFALLCPVAVQAAPAGGSPPAVGKALILRPLTLTKIDDLDFGTLIPSATAGTATIDATTGARTVSGGVVGVPSMPGNRAYFATAGSPGQRVIIAIRPPAQLVSTTNPADTIPVISLTLDGLPVRVIGPTRSFFFGVGGTISINANQAEGVYQAAFDVTAVYP